MKILALCALLGMPNYSPDSRLDAPIEALETWETPSEGVYNSRENTTSNDYSMAIGYAQKYDYYIFYYDTWTSNYIKYYTYHVIVSQRNMEYNNGEFKFKNGTHFTIHNGNVQISNVMQSYNVNGKYGIHSNVVSSPYPALKEVCNDANKMQNNTFVESLHVFVIMYMCRFWLSLMFGKS